ncbi:titin [Amyelois transitella]|uniref:titin n=1 Tax=Amyelois transitella TaxID=680683 RepID=UPI00298F9C4B|nr:titin [Amyelois transitella]
MELDVNLSREGAEPWGFRLIGGTDFNMPLTVVKVLPESPAEKAGLQNGDTVSRIDEKCAGALSHDDARLIVDSADVTLKLGVKRGLYDPILDNYEPIYEDLDQIERAGIDQPSQPTEVHDTFQIQQFLDPNQDIFPREELGEEQPISRSLTASPFVLPAKPYRPFSTEPLPQIPPLEDPIILNPNYRDEFGEILDGFEEFNGKYESRFKLPISEQYDPNWEKKEKGSVENKGIEVKMTQIDNENVSGLVAVKTDVNVSIEKEIIKEDIAFMKKMKQEIDMENIEMTATTIVDESIEKAKTVAEEIKREIDVELSDVNNVAIVNSKSVFNSQLTAETNSEVLNTTSQNSVQKMETKYESSQADVISEHEDLGIVKRETRVEKETSETHDDAKTEVKVSKKVEQFESINTKDSVSDERKKSVQQEVEEIIETGSVRRKSMMFDNEENSVDKIKCDVEHKTKHDKTETKKEIIHNTSNNIDKKSTERKVSSTKSSSSEAEHRAYSIGLKTIPNIRGTVHSSYHYNLLLQTFFLHLTDVMVALSRFILSQPIFNKDEEKQESVSTQEMRSSSSEKTEKVSRKHENLDQVSELKADKTEIKAAQSTIVQKEKIEKAAVKERNEQKDNIIKEETKVCDQIVQNSNEANRLEKVQQTKSQIQNEVATSEIKTHKKAASGSEMAQLSEKKSQELTVKMDAVISEFENKTGIEDDTERRRRSRSRSQIVEEVMKESDPLEWLSKVDSNKSQEITELKTSSNECRSSVESTTTKIEVTRSSTPNEGKQMYVAIVESHVYTNKDTILLDETDISESSSVVEESVMDSTMAVASENVVMEKSEVTMSTSAYQDKQVSNQMKVQEAKVLVQESKQQQHNVEDYKCDIKTKEEVVLQKEELASTNHDLKISKQKEVQEIKEINNQQSKQQEKVEDLKIDIKKEEVTQKISESVVDVHESKQLCIENKSEQVIQESKNVDKFHVESQTNISKKSIILEQTSEPVVELYESKEIKEEFHKSSVKEQSLDVAKEDSVIIQEIISESSAIEDKNDTHGYVELAKEELTEVKAQQIAESDVSADIKINNVEIKKVKPQLESAALKIVKEEVIEVQPSPEILESEETKVLRIEKTVDMSKDLIVESDTQYVDISGSSSMDSVGALNKTSVQESTFTAKLSQQSETSFTASSISQSVQESTFISRSTESNAHKLTLNTDIAQQKTLQQQSSVSSDENNNIDTPTPSTVPPTPLTDEYVFKLQIPLPKTSGTVIPLDLTPEEEEPHIVKKKLVPHIETNLESPIIYDPPLPSPPGIKVTSPVYTKPGLRGGDIRALRKVRAEPLKSQEEILEIERKSTLLASAIDKTIKSIEEYKEQVGMETTAEVEESTITNSFTKNEKHENEETSIISTTRLEINNKIENEWSSVDKQIEANNIILTELSKVTMEEDKVESNSADSVNGNIELNYIKMNGTEDQSVSEMVEVNNSKHDISTTENVNADIKIDDTHESKVCVAEIVNKTELTQLAKIDDCVTNGVNEIRNVIIDVGSVPSKEEAVEGNEDPMKGFRPVVFNPETRNPRPTGVYINFPAQDTGRPYTTPTGELLGTHQGIVDGLEDATVDEEVAKELGKPGMTEEKIAELISGESEMLREAHVMGLTRVITSHMSRADDASSVDFKRIKPIVESLKDSEVLKALNEELMKTQKEKKKEERKWTTFLQKPKRAVPRAKFGYHGYVEQEINIEAPYKVKIVKQPKPKVAPDYKPENFDTGPLPWEERALHEPPPPPVAPEDPILVPEEEPEFLEAVDPLPESEVPDLEDTGIRLPTPKTEEEVDQPAPETEAEVPQEEALEPEPQPEQTEENKEEMESRIADQLMSSVQNMVDPNASLEQQLAQMRAQLAALAQLPGVIQQTLEMVTRQLSQLTHQESVSIQSCQESRQLAIEQSQECVETEVTDNQGTMISEETGDVQMEEQNENEQTHMTVEEVNETPSLTQEEMEKLKKEEEEMLEEQRRIEKQKKEMMEQMRQDQESRQVKQRPTPRVGKPKPVFGNGDQERPMVLPGGRKWRGPKDAYNEQFIAETLSAQAEIIKGKAKGFVMSYESDLLPYDERINFLKYEKPPVSLDHLQHSDVYKLVHNMDQTPVRRVDMLTPVVAEADYREKCRSISPCVGRMAQEQHQDFPQQVQP